MRTFSKALRASSVAAFVLAGAFALPQAATAGSAELKPGDYPNRPITILVCYGKGGGSDQAVAALQGPASKILGVKINKINKPGGGGLNCLPGFAQTPADGYTILQHADLSASSGPRRNNDSRVNRWSQQRFVLGRVPVLLFRDRPPLGSS